MRHREPANGLGQATQDAAGHDLMPDGFTWPRDQRRQDCRQQPQPQSKFDCGFGIAIVRHLVVELFGQKIGDAGHENPGDVLCAPQERQRHSTREAGSSACPLRQSGEHEQDDNDPSQCLLMPFQNAHVGLPFLADSIQSTESAWIELAHKSHKMLILLNVSADFIPHCVTKRQFNHPVSAKIALGTARRHKCPQSRRTYLLRSKEVHLRLSTRSSNRPFQEVGRRSSSAVGGVNCRIHRKFYLKMQVLYRRSYFSGDSTWSRKNAVAPASSISPAATSNTN